MDVRGWIMRGFVETAAERQQGSPISVHSAISAPWSFFEPIFFVYWCLSLCWVECFDRLLPLLHWFQIRSILHDSECHDVWGSAQQSLTWRRSTTEHPEVSDTILSLVESPAPTLSGKEARSRLGFWWLDAWIGQDSNVQRLILGLGPQKLVRRKLICRDLLTSLAMHYLLAEIISFIGPKESFRLVAEFAEFHIPILLFSHDPIALLIHSLWRHSLSMRSVIESQNQSRKCQYQNKLSDVSF